MAREGRVTRGGRECTRYEVESHKYHEVIEESKRIKDAESGEGSQDTELHSDSGHRATEGTERQRASDGGHIVRRRAHSTTEGT